jgi:hypothetical protein
MMLRKTTTNPASFVPRKGYHRSVFFWRKPHLPETTFAPVGDELAAMCHFEEAPEIGLAWQLSN